MSDLLLDEMIYLENKKAMREKHWQEEQERIEQFRQDNDRVCVGCIIGWCLLCVIGIFLVWGYV